jgi:anti-sigma regulatory factor (Ser/Thr protein kinase)
MRVPHAPASAAAVRTRLLAELRGRGLPLRVVDDALLVVSELVSNAVRHGAPLSTGDDIEVRWEITDERVHLEVRDGGRGPVQGAPRALQGSADDESGRGLSIIALLAMSWGSSYDDDGVGAAVWADLPVAATVEQQASEDAERRQEA